MIIGTARRRGVLSENQTTIRPGLNITEDFRGELRDGLRAVSLTSEYERDFYITFGKCISGGLEHVQTLRVPLSAVEKAQIICEVSTIRLQSCRCYEHFLYPLH